MADSPEGPETDDRRRLRREPTGGHEILRVERIVVDVPGRTATRAGRQLDLRPRQFDLLVCLARSADGVVSPERLANEVWRDDTALWTNAIAVAVHELRRALERLDEPTVLHTVRGRGYVLGRAPDNSSTESDGPDD